MKKRVLILVGVIIVATVVIFDGVFTPMTLAQMTLEQQQQLLQQQQQQQLLQQQERQSVQPISSPNPSTEPAIQQNFSGSSTAENNPTSESVIPPATNASFSFFPLIAYEGIAVILGFFAWWQWFKRKKTGALPAEKELEKKVVKVEKEEYLCLTCKGKGTVTNHRTTTVKCGHCKGTGNDICHHCGGTGHYGEGLMVPETQEEVESLMKCDYCGGSGWQSPRLACCMCKGARKETFNEPYETICPTCNGMGKLEK